MEAGVNNPRQSRIKCFKWSCLDIARRIGFLDQWQKSMVTKIEKNFEKKGLEGRKRGNGKLFRETWL